MARHASQLVALLPLPLGVPAEQPPQLGLLVLADFAGEGDLKRNPHVATCGLQATQEHNEALQSHG